MSVVPISRKDLWLAQVALIVAIGLQFSSWITSRSLAYNLHPIIILTEVVLLAIIAICASWPRLLLHPIYRSLSFLLLGLASFENISSLALVARALIIQQAQVTGYELLASALAIFLTNIIVFGLWYWEIDSPGLTGKKWSKHDKDFQFTQQDLDHDFRNWRPSFIDYIYLSVTNAINFAPADARPLTSAAKILMGTQALVSVFTLSLLLARSVSILGQ